MRDRDAAGSIRAVADRTRDLLPTVARVAEIINSTDDAALAGVVERLLVQLELGVPVSLVPIARVARGRLTRGDYLALARRGLVTPSAIAASSDEELASAVGKAGVPVLREVQVI